MNTQKNTVLEHMITRNLAKIEEDVCKLTTFLAPLTTSEAKEMLHEVKNLQASIEFIDELFENLLSETLNVLNTLYEYKDKHLYFALVSKERLNINQELLLINLRICYDNAESLAFRTTYGIYEKEELQAVSKVVRIWAINVMEAMKKILTILAENHLSEEVSKLLLKKVYALNGGVLQFAEMGF